MQKTKPKKINKYLDPWFSITRKFYAENKETLFYDHLLEISRIFIKVLKKEYSMHLADEMSAAIILSHYIEKDIRVLMKLEKRKSCK